MLEPMVKIKWLARTLVYCCHHWRGTLIKLSFQVDHKEKDLWDVGHPWKGWKCIYENHWPTYVGVLELSEGGRNFVATRRNTWAFKRSKWTQSFHRILVIPTERENNDKILRKEENMVIATKYDFVGWLCEWKILTPHTFVVLTGNRLVN